MIVYSVPSGWSRAAARLVRADWEAAKQGSIPTVAGGAEGEEYVAAFKRDREGIPGLEIVDDPCGDGTPRCYARWKTSDDRVRAWAAVRAPGLAPLEEPEEMGLKWPREWALKFVIGGLHRGELTASMAGRLLGLELLEIRKLAADMSREPVRLVDWIHAISDSNLGPPGAFVACRQNGAPDYISFAWEGVLVSVDAEGICYLMVGDTNEIGSPEELRDALDRLAARDADEAHRTESLQTLAGVEGM